MSDKTYYVFISHAWDYDDHYRGVVKMLNNSKSNSSFMWQDYSIPKDDPVHTNGTVKDLRDKIDSKIRSSSLIVLTSGMYANYSKWIKEEIQIAKDYGKSIIAIKPWAQERLPLVVTQEATTIIGWNEIPLIKAIKTHG